MGQKVNPIAVRLNFNRFSDSSWFSDYYYSTLIYQDLNFRQYLHLLRKPTTNKLGFRSAKCIIHHFPKRSLVHLFCLSDPRKKTGNLLQQSRLRAFTGRIPGTNTSMDGFKISPKWLREEESGLGSRAPETGSEFSEVAPSSDLLRGASSGGESREPVTNAPLVAPKARQHGPGSRAYWLNSSIFQKKRALVNLHRLLSDESLSQYARRAFRLVDRLTPNVAGYAKTRFPGLWPWFGPGTGNSGRPIAFCQNVRQQLRGGALRLCVAAHSVSNKEPPTKGALSGSTWFNFYAIHYFFMQKMGDSLGRLPHRIVNAGGPFTVKLGGNPRPGNRVFRFACSQTLDQPVPGPLTYRPNSIWPTIRVRHLSPNRTSRVLCLDRRRSTPLGELSSDQRTRGTVGSAPSAAQRASNLVPQKESLLCTPFRGGKRVNERSSFFGSVGSNQITKSLDFYLSNVHYILSQNTNTFISMRPIKVHSVFQCASLVAQEVACKLEQKKSFRLICRLIFQQLTVCNYIKGIRITCSGRLNGAEIAKTECRKFGETSLHVFSDKIDYARTKASTPYGILGVKVWISYI